MSGGALPSPQRSRWQPLRAGLVDMFFYDYEEFWFRDGHLLLRGNNGTGKSKVLALTLPFLLDGDLSPTRLEPDGDPTKRMEWNLLLGGRYDERLGYTWLELGRRAEDGEAMYATIGCGIKAAAGRGVATRWFFVASGRVGDDFWLVGSGGAALTRDRLIDELDGIGRVYDRAEDYRHAIDERFFRLGAERLEALVSLLIQLRQPQLSKRPNEERLSRALSLALPPLDQAVLSDVADAFHDLERQREELRDVQETHAAVATFLDVYGRYSRIATRRQAADVRRSHGAYQDTQRSLAAVRRDLETAGAEDGVAAERQLEVAGELRGARARAGELRERREVRELEAAERMAALAEERAREAQARAGEAGLEVDERSRAREVAADAAERGRERLRALLDAVAQAAGASGIAFTIAEAARSLAAGGDVPAPETLGAAERDAAAAARRRSEAIAHVQALVDEAEDAAAQLRQSAAELDRLGGERDAARERAAEAAAATVRAAEAFLDTWRGYARSLIEARLPDPDGVLARAEAWAETLDGDDPARAALDAAGRAAGDSLAEARADALARQAERESELAVLVEERERLRRGEHAVPPAPHTRPDGVRDGRAGAPLWQLVDFAEDVDDAARAGLEAALEASGILDAWVMPDGRLLDPETQDVVVDGSRPVAGSGLDRALRVAIDHDDGAAGQVDAPVVSGILGAIGLGEGTGESWVERTGRWRLGVTTGRWSKPAPEFVGRGAREAARRRRLAELAGEIETAEGAAAAMRAEVEAIEARRRTLAAELAGAPPSQPLRDAHLAAAGARREVEEREERARRQEERVAAVRETADGAARARDDAARDLGLPADRSGLRSAERAVADFREAAAPIWPEARFQLERAAAHGAASAALERARNAAAARAGEESRARAAADEARGRRDGLRAAIGATVEDIRTELKRTNGRIEGLELEAEGLATRRADYQKRIGRAEGRQQELTTTLAGQHETRAAAVAALERLADSGLLVVAAPDLDLPDRPWAPDPAARLARRVEQALDATDASESAWERAQHDVTVGHKDLQDALGRHSHQTAIDLVDQRFVVTITFQGQRRSPGDLRRLLGDEVEHRERLLSAREREVLEEHLVNEVAGHLQELIADAEGQVREMNDELLQRPTSTGMKLRLRWEPRADGPAGLVEARARLLRQVSDAWSADDRAAVSAFLQQQIAAVRAADEGGTGTWLEHLTQAFDYRAWHRFAIQRSQDGQWRSASGPASSGERALTVTLPLFAAASAHYRSADPAAPRLVMLDEVFAGIDDDGRAKSMGLLDVFDLDFVMTSEREWGCYRTIRGLSIHQLARREGIDAVHVTRWQWDGRARSRMEAALPAMRAPVVGSGDEA